MLAERSDTKSNVKLGGFRFQFQASYASSHAEELWYNETVCLWMTIYIYIYIQRRPKWIWQIELDWFLVIFVCFYLFIYLFVLTGLKYKLDSMSRIKTIILIHNLDQSKWTKRSVYITITLLTIKRENNSSGYQSVTVCINMEYIRSF